MKNLKLSRKLLPLILSLMLIVSSLPISSVYAATKETIDCSVCNGTGQLDCGNCTDGHIDEGCDVCLGTGTITSDCPDCENGFDSEGNPCSKCSGLGTIENVCNDCDATGKKLCSACQSIGTIKCTTCDGKGKVEVEYEKCPDCNGIGTCVTCEGKGETIEICPDCTDGTVTVVCSNCKDGKVSVTCDVCNGSKRIDCIKCTASGELSCENCNATGTLENGDMCPDCSGNGKVACDICLGSGKVTCTNCSATGNVEKDCSVCNGSKKVDCIKCTALGNLSCENCNSTGTLENGDMCPDCSGNGKVACDICLGSGKVTCTNCSATGNVEKDCSVCNGSGEITERCSTCNGDKTITVECTQCNGAKKCSKCLGIGKIKTKFDDSFKFDNMNPSPIKVGDVLENAAVSESNTTGKISYAVDNSDIATVDNKGRLTAISVGTVIVTASIETDYEYSSNEIKYSLTIEKATPTIEIGSVSEITYGQKLSDSTINAVAKVGNNIVDGVFEWVNPDEKPSVIENSEKTEYEIKFTPNDSKNYMESTAVTKIKVNPADIVDVKVEGNTYTFTGESYDSVTVEGTLEDDKIEYSIDGENYTESIPQITNVSDTKTIFVKVTRNGNYNEFNTSATATINPSSHDGITFDFEGGTYNGKAYRVKVSGAVGEITYTYNGNTSTESPEFTDVGKYEVTVNLPSNNGKPNYKPEKFIGVLVISPADLIITAKDVEKTYDDEDFTPKEVYTEKEVITEGLIEGHSLKVNIDGSGKTVGTYDLIPSNAKIADNKGIDVTENYNISYNKGTLNIIKKDVTVTPKSIDVKYNAKPYSGNGYDIEGLVEGHKETVTISGEKTKVGIYKDALSVSSITILYGDEEVTDNYNIIKKTSDIVISYLEIDKLTDAYEYSLADGENGWYQSKVDIMAKDGYEISYQNTEPSDFSSSLEYTQEGITKPKIAIKEISTGYITNIVSLDEVKIDTKDPDIFDIEYLTPVAYKILSGITFGIYDAPTTVTIKASDENSGISSISYKCGDQKTVTVDKLNLTEENDNTYSYIINIPEEFEGQISYSAEDVSGRESDIKSDKNGIIVDTKDPDITSVDYNTSINVNGKYYYSGDVNLEFKVDEKYFYENYLDKDKNPVSAIENDVSVTLETVDGNKSIVPEKTFDEKNRKIIVKIPAENNDGDYIVKLSYKDPAGNKYKDPAGNKSNVFSTDTIVIDTKAPVIEIAYDDEISSSRVGEGYFLNRTATITVEEHNFDKELFKATVSAKNIANDPISDTVANEDLDFNQWNDNGDIHTLVIRYTDDANYTFKLDNLQDLSKNGYVTKEENEGSIYKKGTETPDSFVVDETQSDIEISTSNALAYKILNSITFGFFDKTEVQITVKDATSGLQKLSYKSLKTEDSKGGATEIDLTSADMANITYEDGQQISVYKFTIDSEYKDSIKATVYDNSGNCNSTDVIKDANEEEYNGIIVDKTDPEFTNITYNDINTIVKNNITKHYYSSDAKITFNVNEEYFFEKYYESATDAKLESENSISALEKDVTLEITKDGQEYYKGSAVPGEENSKLFKSELDETADTITVTIPSVVDGKANDGDFVIKVGYTDLADHYAEITTDILVIDTTAPVVTIGYDNNKVSENALDNRYFNANRTATITVKEHNFALEYNESKYFDINIIANDILTAQDADMGIKTKVAEQLKNILNYDKWTHDGDVHTFDLEYVDDAIYDFALTRFQDYALKDMNPENANKVVYTKGTVSPEHFVVDKTLPTDVKIDVKITYSDNINVVEDVLSKLFWFYNPKENNPCKVTLTTTDMTSGLQYFTYSYNGNYIDVQRENIEDKKVPEEKGFDQNTNNLSKFTYSFDIPAEFRGKVKASATDNAGNTTAKETIGDNTIIVDSDKPILSVDYSAPKNPAEKTPLGINYYSGDVTVTVTVDEENFMDGEYPENVRDMKITANILGDYDKTVTTESYEINNWSRDKDSNKWIGTFILSTEGDYTLNISYPDKSGNAVSYNNIDDNHKITIDKTAPIVNVEFDSIEPIHKIDDREYYNTNRSATITVTEHNFFPEYFETENILKAQDILGSDVTNYIRYFKDETNWTTDGNVHTIKVDFKSDANYTFDFEFEDLAKNKFIYENSSNNRLDDYPSYLFTVDKTTPKDLKVSYSTNVLETVINAITFGYYDSKMTVTISADDDTTGVYHFMYSYLTAKDVSSVNAQLINDAISRAKITRNGKTSTAVFSIPKSTLERNSQFNGTVEFTAYDYAENNTYKADTKRVIVDNISPTASITFNEPVQNANNVSYYAGNIDATISINEANFYSQDVDVIVTKDGSRYPVSVNWTNNSVDSHIGTFRLTEDGDYVVRVVYSDRSGNEMATYESNQLTIDTADPVITVSGLNHQSANNDEKIGFSISVTDKNIALGGFNPVLTAVIRNDNGELETIKISLGNPVTSINGKGETVYTYTVQNLSVDGFYSLICNAVDYANHRINIINSGHDNGNSSTEETMNFSVNREGSTFWIETTHNDKYTDKVFTNELDKAYANDNVEIVVHELNVDQVNISNNSEEQTVFALYDGSSTGYVTLQEGDGSNGNYVKNTLRGAGGWYETRYTLNNDNFSHDGIYSFSILSFDRAGNSNLNTKNESGIIKFTVDRTNPVVTSNISENQVIDADSHTVEFEINDTNHDKNTVEVKLNGKPVPNESITSLGGNSYSFEMSTGSKQNVSVTSKDLAGNTAEQYEINNVTVSTNRFVLFYYSHTFLFWIIIAGVVLLACLILFIVFRRKKDDDEEEER